VAAIVAVSGQLQLQSLLVLPLGGVQSHGLQTGHLLRTLPLGVSQSHGLQTGHLLWTLPLGVSQSHGLQSGHSLRTLGGMQPHNGKTWGACKKGMVRRRPRRQHANLHVQQEM
jgi:hypothetical protein